MWYMSTDELREALGSGAPVTREHWFAEEVLARNDVALADLLLEKDPDVVHRLHGGALRLGSPDVAITESAVLKRLLEAGFDPNRPGWLGKTALHHYAGRGETGNALLVIEHGADIDALDDEYHGTPLAWAAAEGHEDTVRLLLEHGANPNLPLDLPQATPVARAMAQGHEEVVRLL
jgi:ankyrin repeat protein